ncbi:MAG: SPFH/Band 7/PHB domain protein [Firmicutes bacterium]|nr:SPFH/Band 7/PHB domain protein [Bacillota bacterium]
MFTLSMAMLGMTTGQIVGLVFGIVFGVTALIALTGVKVVSQSTARIVERVGKYNRTMTAGIRYAIPIIEKAYAPISLKEMVADFAPQPVITKDNVTMQIDTVIYFQITDPRLFMYGIDRPINAIDQLTATTLRNIAGSLELDETLTSRDLVNERIREVIDEATDPWGIKINRVEVRNILPPRAIQESMEKQMRAERERRQSILLAEGEKRSKILIAEGAKEAAVLEAEAKKIALITEAEGQAEAIKRIINANPTAAYVTLQGFEALKHVADGQSTKIVVPTNIADVTGLLTALTDTLGGGPKKK